MAHRARGNFARAGLTEVVEVRVGEALKLMARCRKTFDLIFLDIDKESLHPALTHCAGGSCARVASWWRTTSASPGRQILTGKSWKTPPGAPSTC